MVFVDSSSASQAARDAAEFQQQMLESLALILAVLMESLKREKEERKVRGEGQEAQEEPLNEEQVNALCAQSVESLLDQYGEERQLENGDYVRMYAAEGFTISTEALDLTGFPVYTLSIPDQGDVLSFQRDPKEEGYIFFETQSTLDLEQKIKLLKSLQATTQQQSMPEFDTPIDRLRWQHQQLGDLAPKGTQAILVAHELLKDCPPDQVAVVTGKSYQIQRSPSGIVIYSTDASQSHKPLYRLAHDSKAQIECNATATHQDHFKRMWTGFVNARQNQQRTRAGQSSKTTSVERCIVT